MGGGSGGCYFRVASSRHSDEVTLEQRWKAMRRGGEWIPWQEEFHSFQAGRAGSKALRWACGCVFSKQSWRVGYDGGSQVTQGLVSPSKDLGFPKERREALRGFSAEKSHHDVT